MNKHNEELVLDHLHATAFQGSGLGRTILGPEQNIKSLTKGDLREYIDTHYLAPQMVIAGAGAVDHQELCDLADHYFGGLKTELNEKEKKSDAVCLDKGKFVGSDVRIHFKSDTMAHMSLAYEGASWTSEYAYPLMILQTLIGSFDRAAGKNVTSQLCYDVAVNELANSISTFNTCYKDTGLFGLYAVAEREKVHDLITCVATNLAQVVNTITEEDVERAKIALKATMLMGLDGNTNVCEDIGRQLLTYGRRLTPAEIFQRIEEMTGIPQNNYESFQILQYKPGEYYKSHHDSSDANKDKVTGHRVLTFFLYLNDVEEGGETHFTKLNISVKPKRGRALVWPSVLNEDPNSTDNRMYHEAKSVEKGIKYAANHWIHQYDFKTANLWGCSGSFA